jgi:hypothetical protein
MSSRNRTERYSEVEWRRIADRHKPQLRVKGLAPESDERQWLAEQPFVKQIRQLEDARVLDSVKRRIRQLENAGLLDT